MIDESDPKYNVKEKGIVTEGQGAVGLLGIYSSDLVLLQGKEHISTLKLSDKKRAPHRCYAACCGTPLGAADTLVFIYPCLIQENPEKTDTQVNVAPFHPTFNMFIDSAPEGSAPSPKGCKDLKGLTPGVLATFLGKLATSLFQKTPQDSLLTVTSTIGIESVKLEKD